MRRQLRGVLRAGAVMTVAMSLWACSSDDDDPPAPPEVPGDSQPPGEPPAEPPPPSTGNFEIHSLSNRADLISGGDALIEVKVPEGVEPEKVVLLLNGRNVRASFEYDDASRTMVGLLRGLVEGSNRFVATVNGAVDGRPYASLAITNHSRGGPVFSGPQMQPWICATSTGEQQLVNVPGTSLSAVVTTPVSGLASDPVDAKCNAASTFSYFYQPKASEGGSCTFTIAGDDPCFVPYDPANPPAPVEIADFTNDRGDTVKSIVRVERGAINRGIYEIVSFFDPSAPAQDGAALRGWNGKLLWMFGASAAASRFQTPTNTNVVFDDTALRQGYMVAASSLNNNGTNANHTLAAETLMMVKEHIVEQYGPIRYTIGNGCSGGSIQQHTIAASYPGLLDGLQPNCSYQDQLNIEMEIKDCGLLAGNYFESPLGSMLSPEKRSAIAGHLNPNFCTVWVNSFVPAYNPSRAQNCGPGFPQELVYDPVLRPDGVRCTLPDHHAGQIGTFVDSDNIAKANRIFDNVGVQYGLQALANGSITAEEFVQLNEGIGSYTPDLVWTGLGGTPAPRAAALPSTLETIYRAGLSGDARHLAQVAIIDLRGDQNNVNGDIHANWRSWAMRERLEKANGHHDNHVIWASTPGLRPGAALSRKAFLTMDLWLAAVESDTSETSRAQKIVANKPQAAQDFCLATTGATEEELAGTMPLDSADCPVAFQASPRQVAGGPLAEDVFKCQLRPLDFASPEYGGVVFNLLQQLRLQAVFPDGVCDWTKPGVGQQPSPGWLSFAGGPGGEPLPPPPVAVHF